MEYGIMDILINNQRKDKCKVEVFTTDNNNITIKIIDKKEKYSQM